jgi:signal transduction histidine kinase
MKLSHNDIFKLRAILFLGVVFYPAWGYVVQRLSPDVYDPPAIRLIFTLMFFSTLIYAFFKPLQEKHYNNIVFFNATTTVIHVSIVNWVSHFHIVHFLSSMMIGMICMNLLRTVARVRIFAALYFLLNVPALWLAAPPVGPVLASMTVITIVLFGLIANSKRSDLQESILEHQAALANASRISAMGEMSAGIAHEINNPLSIILGRLEQLQRLYETGQATKENLEPIIKRMVETVFRIKKLIASMRSLSRNCDNDQFERVLVKRVVEDTIDLCIESLKVQGIVLKVDVPSDLWIDCRPWQISQIILNLVSNSRDAIKGLSDKWIEIKVQTAGNRVQFLFTDSGPGIPKEIRERLMQPFFTTKETGAGIGIGLNICNRIAHGHEGLIHYVPESPNTQFILDLPVKQQMPR